jgi:hypothetical protein
MPVPILSGIYSNEGDNMINQDAQISINSNIKKTPVFHVLFYIVITAGVYTPFWFLNRREQINNLHSEEKLGTRIFMILIVLSSISLFLAIFSTILVFKGEMLNTEKYSTMMMGIDSISNLLSLVIGITVLIQTFKVRSILKDHFVKHLGQNLSFSLLATFFFYICYLQYKINRLEEGVLVINESREQERRDVGDVR